MTFDCFRPPCKNQVPTETSYCSAACKYPDWEARAEKAEARVAELEARDANGLPTHCVDRATWDEMGRELAAAADERDEALARVAELETAICRHVRAREGESDERPDMTVALLYRIEHGIKAREARTAPSVSTEKESK